MVQLYFSVRATLIIYKIRACGGAVVAMSIVGSSLFVVP